jgi:hypothetical protein
MWANLETEHREDSDFDGLTAFKDRITLYVVQ